MNNSFNQDFQLFDIPQEIPSHLPLHSRAQATSNTAPSQQTQDSLRRQISLNQYQAKIHRYNQSTVPRSNSSPAFPANQHQQVKQQIQKPPVPLFRDTSSTGYSPQTQTTAPKAQLQSSTSLPEDMSIFDDLNLPAVDDSFSTAAAENMDYNFSTFTTINEPGSAHTSDSSYVSPQELMKDFAMSGPSSTVFPHLGTPGSGYLESPYMSSLDTSPLMEGALDHTLDFTKFANVPLFPQDGSDMFGAHPADLKLHTSFTSTATGSSVASPMARQKSSPGRPPSSHIPAHIRKHSDTSGVKPTKARKPLPEIMVDEEDDKETAKRKKNTAAARKSRMRKQETHEYLCGEIDRLKGLLRQNGIADPTDN